MRSELMTNETTTATGDWLPLGPVPCTIQAAVVGTGAVTASVVIEVSNNGVDAESDTDSTLALSGTTRDSAGTVLSAPWAMIRARVASISGTGAAVTVTKSNQP